VIGDVYDRLGPRVVVAAGAVAMAAGVAALGVVTQPWQLYPAFLVMSMGWGSMSGAAINIILAPWFERRRGLAVSIAFNGATLGGVCIAPALIALIGAAGFTRALALAAVVLLVVLVAVAACVMGRGPEGRGLGPDGDSQGVVRADPSQGGAPGRRGDALRTWRFWSVSAPFALGLAAQVGVLTHMVALVTPRLGAGGAARAVSATTAAALIGRLATGFVVDRLDRRLVSSATLIIQIIGLGLLAWAPSVAVVYAGCALFAWGRQPDDAARSHSRRRVAAGKVRRARRARGRDQPIHVRLRAVLVGVLRDWTGAYGLALGACTLLQAVAAAMVLLGPGRTPSPVPGR